MNPLSRLVALSDAEKIRRGILYTPREIAQQPAIWQKIREDLEAVRDPARRALSDMGLSKDQAPLIYLIGAGSSDHVGRAVAPMLVRRWGAEVRVIPSTELVTGHDDLVTNRPAIAISFSRSGDTPEGVATIQLLLQQYPKIRHVVITCNAAGAMALSAKRHDLFSIVLDDAVNDRGLCMTSSFTAMVLAGIFLASLDDPQFADKISQVSAAASRFLEDASKAAKDLTRLPIRRMFFLGSGPLYAVARESALKVLELTAGRITTMADTFLGVRHGPLSAVDPSTLLVAFLSSDERRVRYELDLVEEVVQKKLGRECIVIAPHEEARARKAASRMLVLGTERDLSDEYRPMVDVVFGQLLGLFFSLKLGFLPDTPSPSGVIARVVTGVEIYDSPG